MLCLVFLCEKKGSTEDAFAYVKTFWHKTDSLCWRIYCATAAHKKQFNDTDRLHTTLASSVGLEKRRVTRNRSIQTFVFTIIYTNRPMTHNTSVNNHSWRSSVRTTLARSWMNNYHPQHVLKTQCFQSGVFLNQLGWAMLLQAAGRSGDVGKLFYSEMLLLCKGMKWSGLLQKNQLN